MNWIFLNKKNSDEYIEMFARGSGAVPTELETWRYEDSDAPLVIRGIMKHKIQDMLAIDPTFKIHMDGSNGIG